MTGASLLPSAASRPPCMARIRRSTGGDRCGDGVLPIAAVAPMPLQKSGLSRGVRQRLSRERALQARVVRATDAINSMAGFPSKVVAKSDHLSSEARAAGHRLREACSQYFDDLGEDAAIKPQEAHSALLGCTASLYSGENSAVRPFDLDLVALPAAGFSTKPLADFQRDEVRAMLEGHRSGLVRPRAEVFRERKAQGSPGMNLDPGLLADRAAYIDFVQRGLGCGLLRLGRRCREKTGLFCVSKKDGKQKLVFDCRRGNQHFLLVFLSSAVLAFRMPSVIPS